MKTVLITVSGLVQGVGYRYFAFRRAEALGVRGYVRNRVTGDVEVMAQAEESIIAAYIAELRQGPSHAHVRDLRIESPENPPTFATFEIR